MKVTIISPDGFSCLDVEKISIEVDKAWTAKVHTEDGVTTYTYEDIKEESK